MMLLVAFLLSAGAFILAMNTVVTSSFQQIENDSILRDVARVRSAVDQQVAEMGTAATVVAARDVPSDPNRATAAYSAELTQLGADSFLVTRSVGTSATTVFVTHSSDSPAADTAIVSALQGLSAGKAIGQSGGDVSGLLLLAKGPAAVSVRNVAAAAGGNPARVAAVRYLNPSEAAAVGQSVHANVSFSDPRTRSLLPIPPSAYTADAPDQIGVKPIDSKTGLGWASIRDIRGGTALVVTVSEERPIMAQASATLSYTQFGVSLLSLLVGLSIVVMLEGSVLNRLVRLRESVMEFPDDTASLEPVAKQGSDEIADLAIALNTTLGRIKASEEVHKHDARHDHLTGLANRRALLEGAGKMLEKCALDADTCTLVLLDLDGFKRINDELGHQVGDEVLAWFAEHMRGALRADSIMCRLGGDEFAVMMPNTTQAEAVAGTSEAV